MRIDRVLKWVMVVCVCALVGTLSVLVLDLFTSAGVVAEGFVVVGVLIGFGAMVTDMILG